MGGFTKLFSHILDSTIWDEPWEVKGVWVTMLAMADSRGRVMASVPGLARRATVTLEQAEAALEKFLSPDRYSRTPDHDGRRIEAVDGGWQLLNYQKYRDMRDEDSRREQNRLAQQRHRASAKDADSQQKSAASAQAEAEAEAEAEKKTDKDCTPAAAVAPASAPKPKRIKRTRNPFPLVNCGDKDAEEAFELAQACWPLEVTGWDNRARSNVTVRPSLGDTTLAKAKFAELIAEGHATAQELYACAWVATNRWKREGYIYVPHLSTFFGPKKEQWADYLTEARKHIAEMNHGAA